MTSSIRWVNVALRGILETGIIASLAWWGYQSSESGWLSLLLAIAAPAILFGIWGMVDFRWVGRSAEAVRLVEELLLSGFAAYLLYRTGVNLPAVGLALLSLLHHALVYATGDRLLKAEV